MIYIELPVGATRNDFVDSYMRLYHESREDAEKRVDLYIRLGELEPADVRPAA